MSTKTVFVIGAGASAEAGLPTGDEFNRRISNLLNIQFDSMGRLESGNSIIMKALELHLGDEKRNIDSYIAKALHISSKLPSLGTSIDNFIDQNRGDDKIELCAKLAIVLLILETERTSLLSLKRDNGNLTLNFKLLKDTWYKPFFQLLTDTCSKDELKERFKSITLIIFNYDRCVEQFLFHALQEYYDSLNGPETAELVKGIDIFYPYGSVGTLPWNNKGVVKFGLEPNPEELLNLKGQIKTFAEGTGPDSSKILKIREHMGMANRLVFLGFAFHKQNMQLLTPKDFEGGDKVVDNKKCFATTKGISRSGQDAIEDELIQLYNTGGRSSVNVNILNNECNKFFSEFWRNLAF